MHKMQSKIIRRLVLVIVLAGALSLLWNFGIPSYADESGDEEEIVLVIDPGHDGYHQGCSYFGVLEHQASLTIAEACKSELEKYAGITVYMTRESEACANGGGTLKDCLERRTDFALEKGADMLVSMHLNANYDPAAHGAWCYIPDQDYNAEVGIIAKKAGTAILKELQKLGLANNGCSTQKSTDYRNPDGTAADYLSICRTSKWKGFPGIIVEHGFLSNYSDYQNHLYSAAKLRELGVADAKGIAAYYGLEKKEDVLKITGQPEDVSTTAGTTADFTVKAAGTGLKYTWQYSKDQGKTWANWGTKSTFSIEATAARNGYQFRCIVKNSKGKSVTSSVVTLTILPEITGQPANRWVHVGETAEYTVKAAGAGLKYNWQYSKDKGQTWANWGTKSVFSIQATLARHGYRFRCVITDENGKQLTSSAVKLIILPEITAQPESRAVHVGETAEYTVQAVGAGLKYNWQYSKDGGISWANWGTRSVFSIAATAARNGYQFRCIITDVMGKQLTSSAVGMTILPEITEQPQSVSVKAGETAVYTVKATGAGLKYSWQYSKDGGTSWANWGTRSVFSIEATAARNGYQFRCIVTDVNGETLTSDPVELTVSKD